MVVLGVVKFESECKLSQSQLEGTDRINTERNRYNKMGGSYNVYIKKFPTNLVANLFGFEKMPLYKADPGSEKAPTVKFYLWVQMTTF